MQANAWVWRALAAEFVVMTVWNWSAFRARRIWPGLAVRVVTDVALLAGFPASLILVQRLVDAQNPSGPEHVWIHVGVLMPLLVWVVSLCVGLLVAGRAGRPRRIGIRHAA